MAGTTQEARQAIAEVLFTAANELASALAALGEAHQALDEHMAQRLEDNLFKPVQRAYSLARRTNAEFGQRYGLPASAPPAPTLHAPSHGAKGFIDEAVGAVGAADGRLSELQDSLLPIDAGDAQLREGMTQVRQLLASVRHEASEITRLLGR